MFEVNLRYYSVLSDLLYQGWWEKSIMIRLLLWYLLLCFVIYCCWCWNWDLAIFLQICIWCICCLVLSFIFVDVGTRIWQSSCWYVNDVFWFIWITKTGIFSSENKNFFLVFQFYGKLDTRRHKGNSNNYALKYYNILYMLC